MKNQAYMWLIVIGYSLLDLKDRRHTAWSLAHSAKRMELVGFDCGFRNADCGLSMR